MGKRLRYELMIKFYFIILNKTNIFYNVCFSSSVHECLLDILTLVSHLIMIIKILNTSFKNNFQRGL